MSDPVRYALYYVPSAASDLYRFGANVIGYDAYTAKELPFPDAQLKTFADWHAMTSDPRKYGFHATLKAPFALKDEATETDLLAAFGDFAKAPRTVPQIVPVVRSLGHFIAAVPDAPVDALNALADDCVRAFDDLRAPLTEHDRARRLKNPLTDNQIRHLDRWGYPYVFEEFRFHMTLSGSLPQETREPAQALLQSQFATLGLRTLTIDSLTLLRQEGSKARFVVMKQAALRSV